MNQNPEQLARDAIDAALVQCGWVVQKKETSLDITWLRDQSLADLDNLPDPDVLAEEIVENLEAGLESFKAIIASLNASKK